MDRRTLLAIVISMGIMLVWWQIFPPTTPQPPAKPAATGEAPAAGAPAPTTAAANAAATTEAGKRGPEQIAIIEAPGARYQLSSWGGVLRQVILTEERFLPPKDKPDQVMKMIQVTRPDLGNLALSLPKANFSLPEVWTMTKVDAKTVVFRAENDKVAVEKRYTLDGSFRLALDVVFENKSDAALEGNLAVHLYARQDPETKGGGFFSGQGDLATMVCLLGEELERYGVEELGKGAKEFVGPIRWAAADTKYFALAAVPAPDVAGERRCGMRALDGEHAEGFLSFASRKIAPAGKETYKFLVYAGPKYRETLAEVRPGGVDVNLEEVVDVMFAVLSRPLLFLMKTFYGWVGNWGIAIIMLTFFVKLLTLYPTHRAMMSGKKMQRLGPKMQELRKKYENDKQRLGMETMNLYKQHGVSPLGGCLPTLITMPIWMALFSTLNYAVELYKAPFFGYIQDLSARDPYFISPLIMGGIMFLQMRMTPAGVDPQQQKMMTIMMPVMFTMFSLFLAAGLAIYTLTNSALSIVQQIVINRLDKKMHGEK